MTGNVYLIRVNIIHRLGLLQKTFTMIRMGNVNHGQNTLTDRFAEKIGHAVFRDNVLDHSQRAVRVVGFPGMPDHNVAAAFLVHGVERHNCFAVFGNRRGHGKTKFAFITRQEIVAGVKNDQFAGDVNFFNIHNADQAFDPPHNKGIAQPGNRVEFKNRITMDIVIQGAASVAVA